MSVRNTRTHKTAATHTPDAAVPVRLITLREAAAIIGLSPRTLARLVTLERVPGYRFAGMKKLFFKPQELLTLIQPTITQPARRIPRRRTT